MINALKVQTASCVVPIGLLHMGAARHRALLFKVLAGDLGMPCRIIKGRRLLGARAGSVAGGGGGLQGGGVRVGRQAYGEARACEGVGAAAASTCPAAGICRFSFLRALLLLCAHGSPSKPCLQHVVRPVPLAGLLLWMSLTASNAI